MEPNWFGHNEIRRFSRNEYDQLVELGLFEDERIELLHGLIVAKEPQGDDHAGTVASLHRLFILALGEKVEVRSHSPIAASDDSEPEPDVAVIPTRYVRAGLPATAHVVVEVSKKSLHRDRTVKAELYASAGIPEYWVVDLVHRIIEVRDQPLNGTYGRLRTLAAPGERITLVAFPDVSFAFEQILPAP